MNFSCNFLRNFFSPLWTFQIVHCECLRPREASYGELKSELSTFTQAALERQGITRMYSHQVWQQNIIIIIINGCSLFFLSPMIFKNWSWTLYSNVRMMQMYSPHYSVIWNGSSHCFSLLLRVAGQRNKCSSEGAEYSGGYLDCKWQVIVLQCACFGDAQPRFELMCSLLVSH